MAIDINFIDELYVLFDLKSIQLEVLANNSRAIHLYNKLGFKEVGVSNTKIIKGDAEIDSIIMKYER